MNEKLTIQDFVNILAEKRHMDKKKADAFVREFFLLIEQALESDNYVKIKGLGTFKLIEVGSRESVNVNSGERFKIEGHTKISFTPDADLRDLINKPFAHFETVVLNENTVLEGTSVEDTDDENGELENKAAMPSEPEEVQVANDVAKDSVTISEETVVPEEVSKEKEAEPNEVEAAPVESNSDALVVEPEEKELPTEEIVDKELQETEESLPPLEPVSPVVAEEPKESKDAKDTKDKAPISYLVAIIVIVLLLCGGALTYVYYPDLFSSQEEAKVEAIEDNAAAQEVPLDTIAKTPKDTVAEAVPVKSPEKVAPVKEQVNAPKNNVSETNVAKTGTPVNPDSVNYTIVGTKTLYTIKEGETLTRVSLRFYGTKELWPYIVKHNRDVIQNPDNVPFGTTLKIPELTKK